MARRSPAASSPATPGPAQAQVQAQVQAQAGAQVHAARRDRAGPEPDRSPTPKAKPGRPAAPAAPAPLRVLMIASEVAPFSKTGGLADVTAALPRALAREGHDVTVVTPRYQGITAGQWRAEVQASMAGVTLAAGLFEEPLGPGARALFVDCPPLYQRAGLYNSGQVDYQDNPLRFAFLAIAALEWAAAAEQPVSVVHAHDWQAGLAPAYLRQYFAGHPVLGQLPSVFTIHNLAYQGLADKTWVPRLGLGWDLFTPDGLEYFDRLSLLKAGINLSDAVTTVSPTYAAEIQRPEQGFGFDGIIRGRREVLSGILNGVDVDTWDPARDPYLPQPYTAQTLEGKAAAKAALLEAAGLPGGDDGMRRPLVGIVSRLADQKGFDLVAQVAASLADLGAAFVVLGSGEARYEAMWRTLATQPARSLRRAHRVRRAAGPSHRGRGRHVPDAVALRAVRSESDVQPALRHRPGGARHGRTGRLGRAVGRCDGNRHRLPLCRVQRRRDAGGAGRRRARVRRSGAVAPPAAERDGRGLFLGPRSAGVRDGV